MRSIRRLIRTAGTLWLGAIAVVVLLRLLAQRTGLNRVDADADELRLLLVMDGVELDSRATAFRGGGIVCVMGGANIDLREATFAPGATLRIACLMGGANIVVAEGVTVTLTTTAIMGGSNKQAPDPADADVPELHVAVLAIMGGANVTTADRD